MKKPSPVELAATLEHLGWNDLLNEPGMTYEVVVTVDAVHRGDRQDVPHVDGAIQELTLSEIGNLGLPACTQGTCRVWPPQAWPNYRILHETLKLAELTARATDASHQGTTEDRIGHIRAITKQIREVERRLPSPTNRPVTTNITLRAQTQTEESWAVAKGLHEAIVASSARAKALKAWELALEGGQWMDSTPMVVTFRRLALLPKEVAALALRVSHTYSCDAAIAHLPLWAALEFQAFARDSQSGAGAVELIGQTSLLPFLERSLPDWAATRERAVEELVEMAQAA